MPPPPPQSVLAEARSDIEATRKSRVSRSTIIKHYRRAKKALDKVSDMEVDTQVLKETIAAFQDLAVVLYRPDAHLHEKAIKCRQRANTLRQKLQERMKFNAAFIMPSLVGPGFTQAMVQTGVAHSSSLVSIRSTAASEDTDAASTVTDICSSASRQLPSSSTKTNVSISATGDIPTSPLFCNRDVRPTPNTYQLPHSDDPLQSTYQLAYCLTLLQDSVQDNDLSPDALKWRQNTLHNMDERKRLETMRDQIVKEFANDVMKDAASVVEVVQLVPVLNQEHSRLLLKILIDTVNRSEILDLHSLEGLTKVIQGSDPGFIDADDLVRILQSLHNKLRSTHSESDRNRYRLLLAVSGVLDAMVDSHIGDVDRVNLHAPLTDLLRELESSRDPYLTFQAEYATQALLNVSDDDNIWDAGLRRLWFVLKGGAGFAKISDPMETKDALEGLEILYEASKGGARLLKDVLRAIKSREGPTFTVREGFKFKRVWYSALRRAESYIETGRLVLFRDLVTTASYRNQPIFQWGICQLLGRFAAETQWCLEARQDAIAFLGALYRDSTLWIRQKGVDRVIHDAIANVVSNNDQGFEDAKSLQEEMKKQSTKLASTFNLPSQPWNNYWPADPPGHTTLAVTLLKNVQDRHRRHCLPLQTGLDGICSALVAYHAPDLTILRISGEELDLETCFVNLAIVEASENRQMEKQNLNDQATGFHRIPSFESIKNTNIQSFIPLEQLFNKRKRSDGKDDVPRRILVQGRAGIGKTTLCKKLVHDHQNGLWRDLFDAVLWLPFRSLRGCNSRTLEGLFREKVFVGQHRVQEQEELARDLVIRVEKGKVLLILDGLDEITTDTEGDEGKAFRVFLKTLLWQQHVVITSRPSGLDSKLLPPIDLELETIGFSQQNVENFLANVLELEAAKTVQEFIRQTPLIQGLVNIPVQLDVICFSWDSLPKDGQAIAMTRLYQLMV